MCVIGIRKESLLFRAQNCKNIYISAVRMSMCMKDFIIRNFKSWLKLVIWVGACRRKGGYRPTGVDYVRRSYCGFVPDYVCSAGSYGGVRQRGLDTHCAKYRFG